MNHARSTALAALLGPALFGLAFCALAGCRTVPPNALTDGREKDGNVWQKDFIQLARYVERNHCGFYPEPLEVMSRDDYAALVGQTYDSLAAVSNREDFLLSLAAFVTRLEDGHTRVPLQPSFFAGLGLWWFGEELVVVRTASPTLDAALYRRVTAIGGMAPVEYEARVNAYISADRGQTRYKRLSSPDLMMSRTFLDLNGLLSSDGSVRIDYVGEDGSPAFVTSGTTYQNPMSQYRVPAACRNATTAPTAANRYLSVADGKVLYVQLSTLSGNGYAEFWKEVFSAAAKYGASGLVVDVRDNGGGNSQWCDEFLSYLVQTPKKAYVYRGWKSDYPRGNRLVTDGQSQIIPKSGGPLFKGKVVLLTSPRTFSSATFFAVALKDNGLGTLVGEPVGNSSIRFGFMADPIKLENSGLSFATTHHIWARALPGAIEKLGNDIAPDEYVGLDLEAYRGHVDRAYERALAIIAGR